MRDNLTAFDVAIRAGVHTGEVELRDGDVGGIGVHIGARIAALASPGEILVSRTVKDLVTGDITLASTSDADVKGNAGSDQASLSADGTRVAFTSSATNLDRHDRDDVVDVYVKNLTTGDIELASTTSSGIKGNENRCRRREPRSPSSPMPRTSTPLIPMISRTCTSRTSRRRCWSSRLPHRKG